jgi:hypothetical protein
LKILHLAQSRVLLWAREGLEALPFEVSKVVNAPLQGRCDTAPYCPGERESDQPFNGPAWIDPTATPPAACPYMFSNRGDCLTHRNRAALEAALFSPGEARMARRLLEALGYNVREEAIDVTEASHPDGESRILDAHSYIGPSHQVKLFSSPHSGQIVLVRDLANARSRDDTPRNPHRKWIDNRRSQR